VRAPGRVEVLRAEVEEATEEGRPATDLRPDWFTAADFGESDEDDTAVVRRWLVGSLARMASAKARVISVVESSW